MPGRGHDHAGLEVAPQASLHGLARRFARRACCPGNAFGGPLRSRAATEALSAVLASLAKSAKLAVAKSLNNVALAATDDESAFLATDAKSANEAVASGLNVVALAATDAESIVSVTTK